MNILAQDLVTICKLLWLLAAGKRFTRTVPKVFTTSAVTLSGSSSTISAFDTEQLQNEKYPFVLRQIDVVDTTSESNWLLRLADKATDYNLFGGWISSRKLRCASGGTEKVGEPTVLATLLGAGYPIGPEGGFNALARSVGTATVTELTLAGIWILEP